MNITKRDVVSLLIVFCFILLALYLYSYLLIGIGAQKERESKECVGATAIENWEDTLEIAKEICVEGQKNFLETLNTNHNNTLKACQAEVEKWRGNYSWLRKENEKEKLKEFIIYNK